MTMSPSTMPRCESAEGMARIPAPTMVLRRLTTLLAQLAVPTKPTSFLLLLLGRNLLPLEEDSWLLGREEGWERSSERAPSRMTAQAYTRRKVVIKMLSQDHDSWHGVSSTRQTTNPIGSSKSLFLQSGSEIGRL